MKELVVRFLKWALSRFDDKPARIEAWPFPPMSEDFDPRPCEKKTKPRVAKATTRKPAAKTSPAAKRTTTKKAK